MAQNLELKKFDMKDIKFDPGQTHGPVVVLIGRRDTGKSFLVRDLLYYHQDIPIGTVISGTEAGNGFYAKMVPKLFIHDEYNTVIIEKILKRQKLVLKQVKKEIEAYGRSNIDARTFVILDDCLYDNSWAREKIMRLLFMNGAPLENNAYYYYAISTRSASKSAYKYRFYIYIEGTIYSQSKTYI